MQTKHVYPRVDAAKERSSYSRRKRVDTKYLYCGRCIDRRKSVRRQADRIDKEAVERERFARLGPGWL